jgi:uncharacterized lipoprotein YmbA
VNGFYLRFAVAWFVAIAVGCTWAPIHYYTLTPTPDGILPSSQTTFTIDVRVVHMPAQLNHEELAIRTGAAEVTLLENERWASPVNDEIKDAVRLQLRRRLDRSTDLRRTFTKLTVDIDVQHLEAQFGRHALMEASWTAALSAAGQRSNEVPATTCAFHADEKIQPGYAGIVVGYQREIAALADAIAAVVTSAASGLGESCQKSIESAAGASGSRGR